MIIKEQLANETTKDEFLSKIQEIYKPRRPSRPHLSKGERQMYNMRKLLSIEE